MFKLGLRQQIVALAIVPLVLSIVGVTALITWQSSTLIKASIDTFERNMLESRRNELAHLTDLALSTIKDTYEAAAPDDAEAKARVRDMLARIDYGQDGYFFVYDYDGNSIMHPRQAFRNGRNWIDYYDEDGNRVIYDLIAKAKEGGGLYQYKWEKPSAGIVADKLSIAVGLDKWQWMLGTGVYLDDVFAQTAAARAELESNISRTFIAVAAIAIPAVLLVFGTGMLLNLRERRLADSKLQELTQRVIDTQELERTRIARELHDGVSQNLIGVRYVIDLAQRQMEGASAQSTAAMERAAQSLTGAIREVRRLSHDLRPRELDDLGLTAALEQLLGNFAERTGVAVKLESVAFKNLFHPDVRTALYRVAQEALNNVERHAGASNVSIRLTTTHGGVQMVIVDDGKGFDIERGKRRGGGLGLRNMEERMVHFGGDLQFESSPQGTTLRATLPKSAIMNQRDLAIAA